MKAFLLKLLSAVLFFLPAPLLANFSPIKCTHNWVKEGYGIPSGKPVGEDVGDSPFGRDGYYLCTVSLSRSDVADNHYIYIGEVGDASYLRVTGINGKPTLGPDVFHGWSPGRTFNPIYTRWIPFVIPVRRIFSIEGTYEFKIAYVDLVPYQVGIRGGPPTVEGLLGVVARFLVGAPAFTYHLFQIFFFLLAAIAFLFWPDQSLLSRFKLAGASIASALVILQITAIPRTFLPPGLAIKLTMALQPLSAPLLLTAILEFFEPTDYSSTTPWRVGHLALAMTAGILILIANPTRGAGIFYFFGLATWAVLGLTAFAIGVLLLKGRLLSKCGTKNENWFAYALLLQGALYSFDLFNLLALRGRYYYFNHFFFYLGFIVSFRRLCFRESINYGKFVKELRDIREESARSLSAQESSTEAPLGRLAELLAQTLKCARLSITEKEGSGFKFLGMVGNFSMWPGLHAIRNDSPISIAGNTRRIYTAYLKKEMSQREEGELVVIPLFKEQEILGFICCTDFHEKYLSPFIRRHLRQVGAECSTIVELWQTRRRSAAQANLLDLIRHRTHALQLKSEELFLREFEIANDQSTMAFIIGDVVDSTPLNEIYGASTIREVVDRHLEIIWERFKGLGIILTRDKGDFVSLHVPCRVEDKEGNEPTLRCFEIAKFLAQASHEFAGVSKAHGVALPIRYRFVMSCFNSQKPETDPKQAIKGLNLLADAAIDSAARALSSVALPGEVLVLQPAASHLENAEQLFRLPPIRVKGKSRDLVVFLLSIPADDQKVA